MCIILYRCIIKSLQIMFRILVIRIRKDFILHLNESMRVNGNCPPDSGKPGGDAYPLALVINFEYFKACCLNGIDHGLLLVLNDT